MSLPILLTPGIFESSRRELSHLPAAPVLQREGSRPVLVTSVHGYPHLRAGVEKSQDTGSQGLAHLLATLGDSHWLGVGQPGELDSNHHRNTPLKQRMAALVQQQRIKLVVDIHTAHAIRPFDVELGSLDQASWQGHLGWRDVLHRFLRESGFLVSDNQVFKAAGSTPDAQTITTWCYEQNIPCVQLEISSALVADLDSLQALHAHAKLANALAAFTQQVT